MRSGANARPIVEGRSEVKAIRGIASGYYDTGDVSVTLVSAIIWSLPMVVAR